MRIILTMLGVKVLVVDLVDALIFDMSPLLSLLDWILGPFFERG